MSAAGQSVVLCDIADERARQDAKWGPQRHPDIQKGWANFNYGIPSAGAAITNTNDKAREGTVTWTDILVEELCEAVEAAAINDIAGLREELVQVAAVATAWVEDMDTRS